MTCERGAGNVLISADDENRDGVAVCSQDQVKNHRLLYEIGVQTVVSVAVFHDFGAAI